MPKLARCPLRAGVSANRRCIAIAALTDWSAWFSIGTGAPNSAMIASPMNLSIVPWCSKTTSVAAAR